LCIDCILSDNHKSHEIQSVAKATEKQKQLMFEAVQTSQKQEDRVRMIQQDIKRHNSDMQERADLNRKEISQIYQQVRESLVERE
jgi:restriction endonuclease